MGTDKEVQISEAKTAFVLSSNPKANTSDAKQMIEEMKKPNY